MPGIDDLKNLITRIFSRTRSKGEDGTAAPSLQELGRELNRINAETEQEFLAIGGYLQDFSGRAQEISHAAAATAGIIGGPELSEAIAGLDHIFQQTKLLEGECAKGTEILSDILRHIGHRSIFHYGIHKNSQNLSGAGYLHQGGKCAPR